MATQPALRRWTYDDLVELPDDGKRYEIIAGELHLSPSPNRAHQRLVRRLVVLMDRFVEANGLGEVMLSPFDVVLAPDDVLVPDLLFVQRERSDVLTAWAVEGAPDLVVEVLSPSTASIDRGKKRERYARYGVPEYWILDPRKRTLNIYSLAGGQYVPRVLTTGTFDWQPVPDGPTLHIDLDALFRDLE
jgi:Uma2 family endonuclease